MHAQEDEGVLLLRRLDALERLVFGRGAAATPGREVEPLAGKVEALSKSVARAEGGGTDLRDLASQGVTQCEVVAGAAIRCYVKVSCEMSTSRSVEKRTKRGCHTLFA